LGGTTGDGHEEEAKYEIGLGLKPKEFPNRSNHSILHAWGEEMGKRLLRLCLDSTEEVGKEGNELWEGACAGQRTKCGRFGFQAEMRLDFPHCLDMIEAW